MERKCLIVWIFLLTLMAAAPLYAQKTVKVKGVQGRWQVSDDITLKEAEERAFMEAKKEALRKAGVMENVWSVFGQITQESGTELQEAYSQMNVLAIGGMVNVTEKKVEEFWDVDTKSLYKVVTINATVQKDERVDKSYAMDVKGVANLYKEGDVFTCRLKVYGTDSYLKFFWFDSNGGALLYPNGYEEIDDADPQIYEDNALPDGVSREIPEPIDENEEDTQEVSSIDENIDTGVQE